MGVLPICAIYLVGILVTSLFEILGQNSICKYLCPHRFIIDMPGLAVILSLELLISCVKMAIRFLDSGGGSERAKLSETRKWAAEVVPWLVVLKKCRSARRHSNTGLIYSRVLG